MQVQSVVLLIVLQGLIGTVEGKDPGALKLYPGENEIPIVLHNQSLRSIENLDINIGPGAPNWLSVKSKSIALVPNNSLDRHITKFNLSLSVMDNTEHSETILPLILSDNWGRTWRIQLYVRVPIGEQKRTALFGNFPNPFNPSTVIRYRLNHAKPTPTTLIVYDLLGQVVRTLVDDTQLSGNYEVQWNARDEQGRTAASGVYFYSLKSGNFKQTRSMTLLH